MARFRLEWMSLVCLLTGTVVNWTVFYKTDALECHCASGCDSNFQCIGSSNCKGGWSGPTCQRYNLALGKDTTQSSTASDCQWKDFAPNGAACGLKNSSLAVDGIRSTEYWSGTCTHTDVGQRQAWWKVDLGQKHQIYHIKIYFPTASKKRLEGFNVTVDGKPCYNWTYGDSLDPPLSIHCTTPVNGINVLVRTYQEQLILNLCEVEVYDCADGVFGEQCSSLCNCKNPDEVCDKVTGHCQSGCVKGYKGKGCQTRCQKGKYGSRCSETCGNCAGGYRQCNHVDGSCKKGCKGNWDGDQCKVCKDFWFGEQCSTECSCKDVDEVCNKTTGECVQSGCQDGRTGVDCQTPCADGTYGYNCSKQCGNCLGGEVCGKIEGECPSGCVDGFFLPICQVCMDYRFGQNCTKICNCRNSTEVCDKTTGQCATSGCRDGWTGRDCLTPCEDGRYGYNCSGTCGRCLNKEVCNKTDGKCSPGCEEGFFEPLCQACAKKRFGSECNETCGQCDSWYGKRRKCDAVTGHCKGTCKGNWAGRLCKECVDGNFGARCSSSCRCKNPDEICNRVTGHCSSGCSDRYRLKDCQKPCQKGKYGSKCSETCGNCAGGYRQCNHVDGSCKTGCKGNWDGDQCKACEAGRYGYNCSDSCGRCLNEEVCNKKDGKCSECEKGFLEPLCQACEDGRYGYNCSDSCGRCLNEEVCNKTDGKCSSGCEEGFLEPLCQGCEDGRYGYNCSDTCGRCLNKEVCNKTDGKCSSWCEEGFFKPLCQACEDGRYGYNCSDTCGRCLNEEVCNKTDGNCSECEKGFLEPLCKDCRQGQYGPECRRCGQCLNNSPCDKQTGLCAGGCQPGWKGDNCHEACVGSYGYNCNETCGQCLGGIPCDPQTGECPGGCHQDYEGEGCMALKAKPVSSVLTPVLVVAAGILLLVFSLVGVFLYKRRNRRSKDDQTPVVMSTFQDDNANDNSVDQQAPPRPSPYRRAPVEGNQNDDDTNMNVESTVVQVPDLHQYIGNRVDKFESEYLRFRRGLQFPSQVADLDGNNGKNRFKQMYPYDHSRVVLITLPKLKHSDYINASYIDGYNARNEYIATQGPNPVTIGDFWRMVWQEQPPIIVMLTRLTEGKRNKCAEYWPEMGGSVVRGDLQVTCTSSLEKADFVVREFTVHNTKIDQRHHVTQLHFMSWPDHGVPSAPALVRFWKLFRSLVTRKTGPFIIHCSAGVGRTGTFIGLDILVKEARETNKMNVFECVRKMRKNRLSMVQTKEQYHFLHLVVLEALRSETTHMTPSTFEGRFKSDTMNTQEEEALLQEEWKNIKDLQCTLTDKEVAASLLEENIKKSRMKENFPPDALRPKLETPVPDTNDYINAVFIPSEYNRQGLVVTQLPLPWTVVDFWRLVLDHNVHTVVSLEPLQREKPDDEGTYWPETKKEIFSDPFIVSKVDSRTRQITEVSLQVWQKESAESTKHDVTLLLTDGWAEFKDTPSNISNFLHLITRVDMQETSPPVVVMCRNGSTKCGLFCAVLNIIQRLKSDSEIDIFLLIRQLQTFRPGFIRSYEQYKFCYRMVKEYQRTVNAVYENFQST